MARPTMTSLARLSKSGKVRSSTAWKRRWLWLAALSSRVPIRNEAAAQTRTPMVTRICRVSSWYSEPNCRRMAAT